MAEYNIKNLDQTMKLLKNYEPEHSKRIAKTISKSAGDVAKQARADVETGNALGNWGPWLEAKSGRNLGFDGATAKSNIKVTRASNRRRGIIVSNYIGIIANDAATVIWHTAGQAKTNRYKVTSGKGLSFRRNMNKQFGKKRGIWKAYDANAGKAAREIYAAGKEAERIVQRALNSLGG